MKIGVRLETGNINKKENKLKSQYFPVKHSTFCAYLEGYSTERELSQNELEVAQLCLPIRHLELMGLTIQYWHHK